MVLLSSPKALKSEATFTIKQGTVFILSTAPFFYVEHGKLQFALIKDPPNWLSINSVTGVIRGKAPLVYTAKSFQVTVAASNNAGSAEWRFYLTVTREGFTHQIDAVIQRYIDGKHLKEQNEHNAVDLLAYIYEYLNQFDQSREELLALLKEKAHQLNIAISDKPNYKDFAKVITALNPTVNDYLATQLPIDLSLADMKITPKEMENLFRQGSQPAGSIAIPVFNYLGAVAQYVLPNHLNSIVGDILRQAAHKIMGMRQKSVASVPSSQQNNAHRPSGPQPS